MADSTWQQQSRSLPDTSANPPSTEGAGQPDFASWLPFTNIVRSASAATAARVEQVRKLVQERQDYEEYKRKMEDSVGPVDPATGQPTRIKGFKSQLAEIQQPYLDAKAAYDQKVREYQDDVAGITQKPGAQAMGPELRKGREEELDVAETAMTTAFLHSQEATMTWVSQAIQQNATNQRLVDSLGGIGNASLQAMQHVMQQKALVEERYQTNTKADLTREGYAAEEREGDKNRGLKGRELNIEDYRAQTERMGLKLEDKSSDDAKRGKVYQALELNRDAIDAKFDALPEDQKLTLGKDERAQRYTYHQQWAADQAEQLFGKGEGQRLFGAPAKEVPPSKDEAGPTDEVADYRQSEKRIAKLRQETEDESKALRKTLPEIFSNYGDDVARAFAVGDKEPEDLKMNPPSHKQSFDAAGVLESTMRKPRGGGKAWSDREIETTRLALRKHFQKVDELNQLEQDSPKKARRGVTAEIAGPEEIAAEKTSMNPTGGAPQAASKASFPFAGKTGNPSATPEDLPFEQGLAAASVNVNAKTRAQLYRAAADLHDSGNETPTFGEVVAHLNAMLEPGTRAP